jgi:hypothetical protein
VVSKANPVRKARKNKPPGRIWERYTTETAIATLNSGTQLYIRRKWAKMARAKEQK